MIDDERLRDNVEAHRVIELLEPSFRGQRTAGFSGFIVADLEARIANLRGIELGEIHHMFRIIHFRILSRCQSGSRELQP